MGEWLPEVVLLPSQHRKVGLYRARSGEKGRDSTTNGDEMLKPITLKHTPRIRKWRCAPALCLIGINGNNGSVLYSMISSLCLSAIWSTISSTAELRCSNQWMLTDHAKKITRPCFYQFFGRTGGNESSSTNGLLSLLRSTQMFSIRSQAAE